MRHHMAGNKLHRDSAHRVATLRNLATALLTHERIETTHAKARALRPFAERLITMAKRGDLHARRLAARHIHEHEVLKKLFDELGKRFEKRAGGYTRILKIGTRKGDNAMQALIELVDRSAPVTEAKTTAPDAK